MVVPPSPTITERPSTSSSTSSSLVAALSLGSLNLSTPSVKSAKLALTPHHLFYLLSRFEELGIAVGPMKVRLENLHDSTSSANYVSFLNNAKQRPRAHSSDVNSIHSVSSIRSVMSGMSALWSNLSIGSSISSARQERQKAALESDMKYLYSAFTKIPCLKLAPDWRARLISGYEEFPFDSAVPLYVFKNLQTLEINSIDFRQFFGWDRLAEQVRSLTVRRASIEDPADLLIDIVLDDMDKRRRRTSKSQSSPTTTWAPAYSPRRGSATPHPELSRSVSAPGSPDPRSIIAELRVGSLTPPETVLEDTEQPRLTRQDSDDIPQSPPKSSRPRSSSPSRQLGARVYQPHPRTGHRISRSGSASSYSSMADSWNPSHGRSGSSGNLLAMGVMPSSKWRFLRHLSLADNAMTAIPATSLAPLANTLYSLDLSSNLFSQIPDSLASLTALRALNLSHCMIDSLNSLTRNPLPAITALNLRANRLQSLAGVERLYPLERFDVRDNALTDPTEMKRLTGIPDIREIWVDGNPFTRTHKDYRITIFNIFRATPGYTEDIVIDGTGPSYSEKRSLIERAAIPASVPVVKPTAIEIPAVEVNKPTIVYDTPKPHTLRKERPMAESRQVEATSNSRRRRKTPKRRIVDLATADGYSSPAAVDVQAPTIRAVAGEVDDRLARAATRALLPPVLLSPPADASHSIPDLIPSKSDGEMSSSATPEYTTTSTSQDWQETKPWDTTGDYYRQKIEALRDKVGDGYLTVLSEENWDSATTYTSANLAAASSIQAVHGTHHVPAVQPIHSGHTLG